MLKLRWLFRFIICWVLSSLFGASFSYYQNILDHKYKISSGWYYVQNYSWYDLLKLSAPVLFIVCLIYFIIIILYRKKLKLGIRVLVSVFLSYIISYIIVSVSVSFNIFNLSDFGEFIFGTLTNGVSGALIPIIDCTLMKRKNEMN